MSLTSNFRPKNQFKKPEIAAALETAFDPAKSNACLGLDQAAREAAAAWLPPGMA